MSNLKTVLHAYFFDIKDAAQKAEYDALCKRMRVAGVKCFETRGGSTHWLKSIDGQTVELEMKHLFDNQWNTAPIGDSEIGLRVFDWAQDYRPNDSTTIKRGHYLDLTPEILAARADRRVCGYCGYQCCAADAPKFCPKCIDSEYLKFTDIGLTRMYTLNAKRSFDITEEERAELLPPYTNAQLHGTTERGIKRLAKRRDDIENTYQKAMYNTQVEHDGKLWLLDNGIHESAIYYNHTGRFAFGWSKPVDENVKPALLAALADFPFPFDVK